jgi:pre-mRNA-splicing helicase BRR2
VKCQKHTKIKDVTWWVVVGDKNNNLLAMKKVSVKKKVELKLQIDVPDNLDRNQVNVYLMADSYVGLDQVETVKFKIKE